MKDVEEFVKSLVNIEPLESCGGDYGYHPFNMHVEDKNGNISLQALCSLSVEDVYRVVKDLNRKGINKLFLALDFPAVEEFNYDTVVVYSIENAEISCFGIPYDTKTGEIFDRIQIDGQDGTLKKLLEEFKSNI